MHAINASLHQSLVLISDLQTIEPSDYRTFGLRYQTFGLLSSHPFNEVHSHMGAGHVANSEFRHLAYY